jgi:hypothetical protein
MSTTTTRPARRALDDTQISELLALLPLADTVELKVTVPAAGQRSAIAALDLDPITAQLRQVYFLDTPDLRLLAAGVVVRARRVAGRDGDAVVKLRPATPELLTPRLRRLDGFGVEIDAMPGSLVCSARLKAPAGADIRALAREGRPLRKIFSKAQRALYAAHAPAGVELDDLAVLGPIFVLKLRQVPPALGRKLVAELWLYPDDSRVLELSAKSLPGEAFELAARLRAYLAERGVDTDGEQETKTRRALTQLTAAG